MPPDISVRSVLENSSEPLEGDICPFCPAQIWDAQLVLDNNICDTLECILARVTICHNGHIFGLDDVMGSAPLQVFHPLLSRLLLSRLKSALIYPPSFFAPIPPVAAPLQVFHPLPSRLLLSRLKSALIYPPSFFAPIPPVSAPLQVFHPLLSRLLLIRLKSALIYPPSFFAPIPPVSAPLQVFHSLLPRLLPCSCGPPIRCLFYLFFHLLCSTTPS
ncbi:unnamed protein product [Closterium sp. Naga37s-1]|nr:unnamed protein product [Closterium sp. Naga37s-1]